MVAKITDSTTGEPLGIHRTFLAPDGKGKAPVDQVKMMLGPSKGGVARLGEPEDDGVLMIGEGIETCLSVTQVTGYPAWTALSAGGLRDLELPPGDYKVIILADADGSGEKAARAAAKRWVEDERRKVFIAWPPPGQDFNNVLCDSLSKQSPAERIKPEESKVIALSTKDMFRPEITGDHSVFDFINMVKETYNHVGDNETSLTGNNAVHPILEIINNAEEVHDPIDELTEEARNGTLTPEKLLSPEKIDRIARRCEEDEGQAFYEGFRNIIMDNRICRVGELDKAVNKRRKEKAAQKPRSAMGNHQLRDELNTHSMIGKNDGSEIRVDPEEFRGNLKSADPDEWEWMKKLQKRVSRTGIETILSSTYNLQLNLRHHPAIGGTFRINEKTCRVEITRPIPNSKIKETCPRQLTDEDITAVQTWLSQDYYSFKHAEVAQQIDNVATENAYNPLVDWLKSLPSVGWHKATS